MHEEYLKKHVTDEQFMAHTVEELGEVLQALGKTMRFGLNSFNPELPAAEQRTNREWLMRELDDLEGCVARLRRRIQPEKPVNFLTFTYIDTNSLTRIRKYVVQLSGQALGEGYYCDRTSKWDFKEVAGDFAGDMRRMCTNVTTSQLYDFLRISYDGEIVIPPWQGAA